MTVSETTHHSSSEAVRNVATKTDSHKVAKKGGKQQQQALFT